MVPDLEGKQAGVEGRVGRYKALEGVSRWSGKEERSKQSTEVFSGHSIKTPDFAHRRRPPILYLFSHLQPFTTLSSTVVLDQAHRSQPPHTMVTSIRKAAAIGVAVLAIAGQAVPFAVPDHSVGEAAAPGVAEVRSETFRSVGTGTAC